MRVSNRRRRSFIELRDRIILEKIVAYCQRIAAHLERFHHDAAAFQTDFLFQDACCMCVVQIGELAGQLSEDARRKSASIPWRIIKDTRNYYVHAYGSIDIAAVWDTLIHDIPALRISCERILKNED